MVFFCGKKLSNTVEIKLVKKIRATIGFLIVTLILFILGRISEQEKRH